MSLPTPSSTPFEAIYFQDDPQRFADQVNHIGMVGSKASDEDVQRVWLEMVRSYFSSPEYSVQDNIATLQNALQVIVKGLVAGGPMGPIRLSSSLAGDNGKPDILVTKDGSEAQPSKTVLVVDGKNMKGNHTIVS